jgi:hypothetical protein
MEALCLYNSALLFSQAGMWSWIKGSDTVNPKVNYGVQGIEAVSNTPAGLVEPCAWTDTLGNFWLFGGSQNNGLCYADLWKFNPVINNWTWVKGPGIANDTGVFGIRGQSAITNNPPSRAAGASWIDKNGNLWLYSGLNYELGDMWEYNIANNMWTWMQGPDSIVSYPPYCYPFYGTLGVESPENTPGTRVRTATWVDKDGNLWLYGGSGYELSGDLWRYNTLTNYWTWMGGTDTLNILPRYGTQGIPASGNTPGCRDASITWTDAFGNFWLYGGFDANGAFNDMWEYNPITKEWAWMAGTNSYNSLGNYGVQCESDTGLESSGRVFGCTWKDKCGNFWLCGGTDGDLTNDLWNFNPLTLKWTLANGSNMHNIPPVYGTLDSASITNTPGGREHMTSWFSQSGQLYFFGGKNYETFLNDVWKFTIDQNCGANGTAATVNLGSDTTYCSAFTRILSVSDSAAIWSTGDTGNQITVSQPGNYSVTFYSCNNYVTDSVSIAMQTPVNSFNLGADTTYCSAFSRVLATANPNTYWSTGDTSEQITVSAAGMYWGTSSNSCNTVSDTIRIAQSIVALQIDSISTSCGLNNGSASVIATSGARPFNFHWNTGSSSDTISALKTGIYEVTVTDSLGCSSSASAIIDSSYADSLSISAGQTNLCQGDTALICADTGFTGYLWSSGQTTSCISADVAAAYSVQAIGSNGCQVNSNAINIFYYASPPISLAQSGDTLYVYNAFSVQWYLNDTLITGATDSVFIATSVGHYTVQITDTNGCKALSSPVLISGIRNEAAENSIAVFPNPTTAGWKLQVNSTWLGSSASIFDASGRHIFESIITNQYTLIEIPALANGVYELRVISGNHEFRKKLIKV